MVGTTGRAWVRAWKTLRRPPEVVVPLNAGRASTWLRRRLRSSATGAAGYCERRSASAPLTKGAAIDVPSRKAYGSDLGATSATVLRMFTRGAASAVGPPRLEKAARPSLASLAATTTSLGRLKLAG